MPNLDGPNLVVSILSAATVAAIISGLFLLYSKRLEFANIYFKLVIDKRLEAYVEVEHLISQIKVAVHDDSDYRLYHLLFSKDDDYIAIYQLLMSVMSKSMWLSDALFDKTRELNLLIFREGKRAPSAGLIQFGKSNYLAIGKLRTEIERIFAKDLSKLHNVPAFLRRKRPKDSYAPLSPHR
jgi:hypothetical protein